MSITLSKAQNPEISIEDLIKIAIDTSDEERFEIVTNLETQIIASKFLLLTLSDYRRGKVVGYLNRLIDTSPEQSHRVLELFSILVKDHAVIVRRKVVETSMINTKELSKFAKDDDEIVRRNIASNPSTPPEILHALSSDSSEKVVMEAIKNPATTPLTLISLINTSGDGQILYTIIKNASTPIEVLKLYISDSRKWIRESICRNSTFRQFIADEIGIDPHLPDEWKSRVIDKEIAERYGVRI